MDTYERNTYSAAAAGLIATAALHRSAEQQPEPDRIRYSAHRYYLTGSVHGPERWSVIDWDVEPAQHVDIFRTRSGADHAARELNAYRSHVEPHRTQGCRVQPTR